MTAPLKYQVFRLGDSDGAKQALCEFLPDGQFHGAHKLVPMEWPDVFLLLTHWIAHNPGLLMSQLETIPNKFNDAWALGITGDLLRSWQTEVGRVKAEIAAVERECREYGLEVKPLQEVDWEAYCSTREEATAAFQAATGLEPAVFSVFQAQPFDVLCAALARLTKYLAALNALLAQEVQK